MKNLDYFSSLCEEKTTFAFKLMRFSINTVGYSDILESIVLSIEYLQLLSQAFLIRLNMYSDSALNSTKLGALAHSFAKIFDLSYITEYNGSTSVPDVAFIVFSALFILKLALFIYIVRIAMKNDQEQNILVSIWKWVFLIQGRILYFLVSSFWVGYFQSLNGSIDTLKEGIGYLIKTSFWILVVGEYSVSFLLKKYFTFVIPVKDFLSSKTDTLVLLTLTQKILVQGLQASFSSVDITDPWVYSILDLIFDFLRIYHFLTVLPFYKSKALFLQARLLTMIFAFNLASAAQTILNVLDYSADVNFLLIVWIILTIVISEVMINYLKELIIQTIKDLKQQSPALWSHKVFLMKEFKSKAEEITRVTRNHDWKALVIKSLNIDSSTSNSVAEFCLKLLNDLSVKFPKYPILKLYIANYYSRKLKKCTIALRLLSELQKSPSYVIRFNASLLVEEVQSAIRQVYENSQSRLDIFTYTRSRYKVVKLKKDMHKQAQLQITICTEMHKSFPNLASIFDVAQSIHNEKLKITKQIKTMNGIVPEYYLEPIALCANYSLVLNNLIPECRGYMKKLVDKSQKYQKFFDAINLCQENLFQRDAAILYLSGMKESLGKITYASKKALEIYGQDPRGQETDSFMIPILASFWKKFSSHNFETGEYFTPNSTGPVFIYSPNTGYITPVTYFLNVHPFIWGGLHFITIFRPIPESKEYIQLSENGEIQAFTEKIAKKLKLASIVEPHPSIGIKIGSICPEFEEIDKSFTVFSRLSIKQQKEKEEDPIIQKAKRFYDLYSTTGEVVKMATLKSPLKNNSEADHKSKQFLSFHCIIKPKFYGNILMKTLILEEIKQGNSLVEEENDYEPVTKGNRSSYVKNLLPRNEVLSEEDTLVHSRQQSEVNGIKTSSFEPEELLSSNRGLLPQKLLTDKEISMHSYSMTLKVQHAPRRKNSNESINRENRDKLNEVDIDTYSLNSQRSNSDSGLRKMKAYNDVLASSYYSRKYIIFFILLCVMTSSILINQSILKVTMDNYIANLKSKKDALIKAKARSLKMMDIHRNMRALWWYGTSRLYAQDVSSSGGRPSGIISRLPQYILDLSEANKDLRTAVDHLDVNIRKQIFDRDVRMFETDYDQLPEKFINVTNLEATDSIVGDSLQVAQEAAPNITALVPRMSIILRNILNDVLLQTEDGVLLYLISLGEDMTNNRNVIVTTSCCMLAFLIVILGVLNCILYSQYVKEARYMTSIRSFDLKDIHTIQDRLFRFCQMIEEETSFEELPPLNVSQFYYRRILTTKSNDKARKQIRETGNTLSGIKKKYILYAVKLSVLILLLIGFMGLNSVLSENLTKSLNQKVNQIQVMMSLNGNITLLASIAIDMISDNNNTLIFNTPPSTLYLYTLQQITQGKNLALDIFETSSNKELQSVQPILFGDQCPTQTAALQSFCYNMTGGQKTAGFVHLSTKLESLFVDFKNRYDSSNKSDDMLKSFRVEAQISLSPKTIVVQALGILIFKAVNQELEDSISSGLTDNTIGITLVCTFLALICFIIYWCVLVKVRESDNEFKRVLQVFPANVVLSNFILRLFVMKAARGNLDSLKSEL